MTRFGYVMATYAAVMATIIAAFVHPLPRFIWNASGSAPLGLYRIATLDVLQHGDLVAVLPPSLLATFLANRGYLPRGVPLLKHVAALSGQRVCRIGTTVTIEGVSAAEALVHDSHGRGLPVWNGCRTLAPEELFLLNPSVPDSLDGRYFGPLPTTGVLGRAIPMLTRDTAQSPLAWRGMGS